MLLDDVKKKRKKHETVEPDEAFKQEEQKKEAVGRKIENVGFGEKKRTAVGEEFRGVSQEDWEALLLETARRAARKSIGMPQGVPVPAEIRSAAEQRGANGRALSLWIAVVAALLAVAAAGGPKAALSLPGTVGAIMSSARTQGRGGFQINAAAELDLALQRMNRREIDTERTGAGEFFEGTEG